MRSYIIGQRVQLETTFTDDAGVAGDPTTITFRLDSPSKARTTYVYGTDAQLVRDSAGVYHVNIDTGEAGIWNYRFEGAGAIVAVDQDQFKVMRSLVPA